jgi:hypothetical protein
MRSSNVNPQRLSCTQAWRRSWLNVAVLGRTINLAQCGVSQLAAGCALCRQQGWHCRCDARYATRSWRPTGAGKRHCPAPDTAQPRYGMSEEELQAAGRQVPLGRMSTPRRRRQIWPSFWRPKKRATSLARRSTSRLVSLLGHMPAEATRSIHLTVNGTLQNARWPAMTLADFPARRS